MPRMVTAVSIDRYSIKAAIAKWGEETLLGSKSRKILAYTELAGDIDYNSMPYDKLGLVLKKIIDTLEAETRYDIRRVNIGLGMHLFDYRLKMTKEKLLNGRRINSDCVRSLKRELNDQNAGRNKHCTINGETRYIIDNGIDTKKPLKMKCDTVKAVRHCFYMDKKRIKDIKKALAVSDVTYNWIGPSVISGAIALTNINEQLGPTLYIDFKTSHTEYILVYRGSVWYAGITGKGEEELKADIALKTGSNTHEIQSVYENLSSIGYLYRDHSYNPGLIAAEIYLRRTLSSIIDSIEDVSVYNRERLKVILTGSGAALWRGICDFTALNMGVSQSRVRLGVPDQLGISHSKYSGLYGLLSPSRHIKLNGKIKL